MKFLLFLILSLSCRAATFNDFIHAIHAVETGGRLGPILGDNGRALGPLQIHRKYFQDSGVGGQYKEVADLEFAKKVVRGYLNKYAHNALVKSDWETCARVHNSGPNWQKKVYKTDGYWRKVQAVLNENNKPNPRLRSPSGR